MKVNIAAYDETRQGGGWTFSRNLAKGLGDIVSNYEEADIYFIPSPSMVSKEAVHQAKQDNKKIVLRIDNIVRNSRNRNTGMSRMKSFAEVADLIVYQSQYSADILGKEFLNREGAIILNGCDMDIFTPKGREESLTARFTYSRVNRDETKNWEMARFVFQQESHIRNGEALFNIVGQFSPELVEYNFDFYQDERYHYWGTIADPNVMAAIYRNTDYLIYTFWNDACSNTLIEALCSGCEIFDPYNMLETGGAPDIMHAFEEHGGRDYFSLKRMADEYIEEMAKL